MGHVRRVINSHLVLVRFQHSDGVSSGITVPASCLIPTAEEVPPHPSPYGEYAAQFRAIAAAPAPISASGGSLRRQSRQNLTPGKDARSPALQKGDPAAAASPPPPAGGGGQQRPRVVSPPVGRVQRANTMPPRPPPRQVPCVVCGRNDRPGEVRKSGFKCQECVGKSSGGVGRKIGGLLRR